MLGVQLTRRVPLAVTAFFASLAAVSGASALAASPSSAATVASTAAAVSSSVDPWLAQELTAYAGTTLGPFSGGEWSDAESTCWACNDGAPATVAATLYVLGGESNAAYLSDAESTIGTAIADQQQANGGFDGPSWDPTSEGTDTMWFAVELGTTYELLAPYLDTTTKQAWQNAMAAAANYIVTTKNLVFYANGNLNLGFTEMMWMAWQMTGQSQYLTDYNNSWSFVMDPPQARWPGYGWVTVQDSSDSDGADGAGYFTEAGASGPGWDPYYATLQLDVASRLYLLSGDPRALQAANMIMNMELPLLNTNTWILNSSNGTRHTGTNTSEMLSSGFAVLALDGGRSDLLSDVLPQLQQYENWYTWPNQPDNAAFRRAFGNSIDTIALAAAVANPAQSSLMSRYGMLGTTASTATPVGTTFTPASMAVGSLAASATNQGTTTTVAPTTTTKLTTTTTPTTKTSTAATPTTKTKATTEKTKTTTAAKVKVAVKVKARAKAKKHRAKRPHRHRKGRRSHANGRATSFR